MLKIRFLNYIFIIVLALVKIKNVFKLKGFFKILFPGGQAPKAIRSVECYDFKSDRWFHISEMPTRRCRCGVVVVRGRVFAVGGFNGSLRVRNLFQSFLSFPLFLFSISRCLRVTVIVMFHSILYLFM